MNLCLDPSLAINYASAAQQSRRLTEGWVEKNMYCPRCANPRVYQFRNNKPVADFFCSRCGGQYELKSKRDRMAERISDGAYATMIERIQSNENPDFLFLTYSAAELYVKDLIIVPKHFFVPSLIERRPPLAKTAKRAGWIGCNILLSAVPSQGRIAIIRDGKKTPRKQVVQRLHNSTALADGGMKERTWILDVLRCVNAISNETFTLADVYRFEGMLSTLHPSK